MDDKKVTKNQLITVGLILFFALILRLYLSPQVGFEGDIEYDKYWANEVYINGTNDFYQNSKSDYPPIYIYILWCLKSIENVTSFSLDILLKIPAIITDIITSFLIFIIAKRYTTYKIALSSMIFYTFNPGIIFISSIWGQIDSIYTLFLILTIGCFIDNKPKLSASFFALSVLTKPQSLVILPFLLILFYKKYSFKKLLETAFVFTSIFLLIFLPFIKSSLFEIYKLYSTLYVHYNLTSYGAYNFWGLGGFNVADNITFLFISYQVWGYILFGVVFIGIIYKFLKNNDDKLIYMYSALLFFGFFMLFTRIHERYMFPMFAFLVIAMIFDKRIKSVYILASITFFINLYMTFMEAKMGTIISIFMFIKLYVIIINIVLFIYLCYCLYSSKKYDKLLHNSHR